MRTGPSHARGFVYLARAAPAAATPVEQTQHPIRIGVAMAQELAEVLAQAGEAVAGGVGEAPRTLRLDLRPEAAR